MTRRLVKLAISLACRGADIVCDVVRHCSGRPPKVQGVVLYYHAIKAHQRDRFSRQMDELVRCSRPFRAECPEAMTMGGWHSAVTFDDGFVSVVENALPELRKRNIPCVVFVPSGCLGLPPSWIRDAAHPSWEERVVSADELRAMAADPLVTVGSHSVNHPNLLKLGPDETVEELSRSKAHLEAILGREVGLFSFPHGAHSDVINRQARLCGYQRVFTVEPSILTPNRESFAVGRVLTDPDDWGIEFRLKLSGAYRWQHYLHSLGRRRPYGDKAQQQCG